MSKADEILKKYGITEVRGSEEKGSTTTSTTGTTTTSTKSSPPKSTNGSKADDILKKYGITEVRGSEGGSTGSLSSVTDSAQSWLDSSMAFLSEAEAYANKYLGSWHTKDEEYETLMKRSSSLIADAYIWKNQFAGDDEVTAYFDEVISALSNARGSFKPYFDYYGQWETAEDYNFWEERNTTEKRQNLYAEQEKRLEELKAEKENLQKQMYPTTVSYPGYGASSKVDYTGYGASSKIHEAASQENIKKLGAIDDEIASIEMEMANYRRGNYNDRGQHYGSKVVDDYSAYTKESDFDTVSANRAFANPTKDDLIAYDAMSDSSTWYFDANGTYRDAFGNELKVDESGNWVNPAAGSYPVTDRLGMFLSASESDIEEASATTAGTEGVWANVLKDGIDGDWDQLEKGEISIYYYLLNSSGQQAADKYLADMKTELNRRGTMKYIEKMSKAFDEANTLERIALSLATTPVQFVGNATAFIEDAANTVLGNDINPYSAAHALSTFSTTVRSKQAEAWDEATGGFELPFINVSAGDMYQFGMSALDSIAGRKIGAKTYGRLMFMGAASSEAKKLYEQGATSGQIAWGAGLAGLAEMLAERYSIESLIKLKDAKTVGQFVKNVLIQGGIEATEEGVTELANTITNAIVMGDESDWAKLLEKHDGDYLGALIEKSQEIGKAAFGGFVSGGIGGSTYSAPSFVSNKLQMRSDGKTIKYAYGGVDSLQQLAKEVAEKSSDDMKKTIQKQSDKLAKKATAGRAGLLYDTVKNANNLANASANQADIAKSLERKGFNSETANDIAEALVAQYNGQELTEVQSKLLESVEHNTYVRDAISNIMDNVKSTMGQRSQNIRDFGKGIYRSNITKAMQETAKKNFTPEGEYEASETGKAVRTDTNEEIDIKGVASVSKGKLMLELADGQTIDAKSVSFANEADALIYEAVARLGDNIDAKAANKLISKFNGGNAMVFARGMAQAYTWGFYGFDKAELSSESALTSELTPEQINTAYGLGMQYRPVKDTKDRDNARATKAPVEKGVYYRDKDGNATDIETYMKENGKKLNARQKTAVEVMRKFSETMGARFHVFESWVENGKNYYLDENGEVVEGNPNGFYDTTTGEIYIALDAGAIEANGFRDTMLFTIAHEMTHFMRQWSPEHFTKISKIIFQQAGFKGHMSELVAVKQAKAKAKGKPISYDTAVEEVVADGMETILKDGKVVEFMAEVKQKDHTAWQKLKGWFKNLEKFLRKLVTAYRYETANTIEGDMVANFANDLIRQIQQIWAEGAVAAGENYQAVDGYKAEQEQMSTDTIRGSADGAVVQSEVTEAIAESKQQIRTEFEALPKQVMNLSDGAGTILHLIEGLTPTKVNGLSGRGINGYTGRDVRAWAMKNSGFTQAQIKQVNKFMDTMADFMEEAGVTYKFIGLQDVHDAKLHYTYNADGSIKSIVLSAMVKNGDYPVNFDLSSICKKRVAMSKLIDKLAKRGSLDNGTVKLTPANIFKINTALKNEGYETACLGCFVESKRYNSLEWAKKFCNKWNAAVKKVNPNATYFGYGDATFSEDSFTLDQAVKIDDAANKYIKATKTERLANALVKYKAKEQAGLPLVESFSKAARDRLVKSETISDELKTKYLNCDPTTLNIADVEFLLENGILPGAALSNKQAVTEMVKSGEAYQHLLRPSDLLTDRGISKLEALPNFHGVLYGHYGSGTPKLMQSYTPYNSEIALLPAKKGDLSLAEYLYSIAGVRMQSFSDFQIQNIYDYLQMVGDLAARKLPAHAYTKEIPFAKLLGMTGIKVNLSVMFDIDPMVDKAHAGLTKLNKLVHRGEYAKVVLEDAQGKWVYNIGDYQTQKLFAEAYPDAEKRFLQSIGFGDAVKLQSSPGYSANCGIIGVGYSDLGIFAMLNDNRIRYIIPYHASSLPAEIKVATNIALGTDYTPYQNNMKIKEIVDRNGNKVNWTIKEAYKRLGSGQAVINELNEKIRTEGWVVSTSKAQTGHGSYGLYEDLQQTNDPRQTASNFMDWCIGNSTLPLFYQFASHENYYKLIYDYNVYDCVTEEYAPQQAVTNTYPTMVDGQVQPGNVTEGGFNAEYFQDTIDKQMAFMDEYSRNLDEDLDALVDNMEKGTLFSNRDGRKVLFDDRIRDLTEEDVYNLIENSNHGEYALDTFIPVRRDTPPLLIYLSQKEGLPPLKNLPIIMNVEHIQQCMDDEVAANDGKRGHALTTDNIIQIVKGLDDPRYVFFQKDNKRYCEIVEYDVGYKGEKAMAIVTYAGTKNQDLMNGFPGREYNILVTAYAPDPKHWRDYQKSSNNVLIYDKIKDAPQGSYGSHVPSLLSGSPFATKLAQSDAEVNKKIDDLVKNSDRYFPSNAEDIAKEYFGTTTKWSETGWLLQDGTQLDFSGRHWERDPENEIDLGESYYSGKRNMEHYEIAEAFPELREFSRMEYRGEHLDGFLRRGNIRIVGNGIVGIESMPTEEQFVKLHSYFSENIDKHIVVGIGRDGLDFSAGTKASTITEAIRDYFSRNRGNQSDLMRFHTKYSDRDAQASFDDAVKAIQENHGTESADVLSEMTTDVMNTLKFSDRDEDIRDETYSLIGKELLAYEEGDMAPDLTLVETFNERTGKTETTIKHYGQKPNGYIPKKIAYCYKLFEQHPDGTLHALFAGARSATPIGEWQYAQGFPYTDDGVKGMNLRERYGWHLSAGLPSAPHLMSTKDFNRGYPSKNAYGHPKGSKRVWVRMAYDASTDFNSIADSTKEGDIFGLIPFGGYYAFKENNQSEWVISSAVKIDKILKEEERQQILRDAGYDEYEAWRKKHRATDEEKAANKRKSAENKKAKDKAIKAGLNYLSESSKAMREAIQSRIIDNPEVTGSSNDSANTMYSDRILMGSLFSGGGTLEAGLVYQMLDKEFAVEYNKQIAATYTDNHGKEHMFVGDVRDFNSKDKKNVFYLHASPVCKNFSPASHSGGETTLDIVTAQATARVLEEQMPQVFTVENVKRYVGSEAYTIITDKLTELGYKWDVDVYKASDYGNATKRERMIIRAVKDGSLPAKPAKVSRITSWGEATRDLWDTDLIPSTLVKSKIEAIRNTPALKNLKLTKLDRPLMIYDTTKSKQVTYAWADELAPTLTTKCGDARIIMPDGKVYEPTPRFMGRIQGLPDNYQYPKAKTNAFKIIGNGIPTQLTKAVMGGVLDSAYEQTHDGDVLYQDRADDSVSNRSLLANAFEGIAKPEEQKKVQEYKDKIALINAEEQKLRELNAQIKELSFAKGPKDTKKLKALRFDANQAANRINTYDKQLLRLEASQPLQDVLAREKKRAYAKAAQRGREALAEYKAKAKAQQKETVDKWRESRKTAVAKARETADKRDARAKLQKLVLDTVKWISYPAKTDVKCPDILKKPYKDFLDGIDLSSERLANGGDPTKNDLRLANAMDSLATALDRVMTSQDPSQDVDKVLDIGYLDLPANFVSQLRDMTEAIKTMMVDGDYVVNTMTASEVRKLSQMIRTLNHAIKTMSKLYANLRFANIEALGFDTMDFLDALGEIEKTGGAKDFVQWDNALPYYAFKRFGKGGESVFEGLMDAQDKLAFLAKDIFAFQEKTWTGKEAKEWSEDTHTIDLPNGEKLTLTTADAMSIYCLSRRQQGIQHLLGGGVRVMGIQKGSTKAKDSRSLLTIEDIDAIISSLTDRQKQVAEGIQEFMSTVCSDWGNEISMKRFLTKEFTEKFYFPIESNDENLTARDPAAQQSDLFRLLNISATKPLTQGANNEVIIRNIFDVFTGHASDMARLNAYGLGLLDYMKWLNYRERSVNDEGQVNVKGVRKSMEKAYGKAANSYVLNLIKDVNGRASDGGDPNILMKWMRSAKTASVGNSLRVATLQVTSYPRAALVLSSKSLALGLTKKPNIEKAKKYCGIALWKSFGFYDTNIGRSIEEQMKGVTNIKQKLIELSLKGAEWGDAITWGALWNACEYEVAKTTKNEVGSEEFYQEVGKKLREVVYRTQVVDSTLTRSQIMRSKRGTAQEAAAFMSEPTLSANILMDAGFEFNLEKRRTGSAKAAWKKTGSTIGRAVAVYSIGQLAAALMEGLWDAWRDDEDEEFGKKFLRAFGENLALDLVPFNKIPIVSDAFEALLAMFGVGYYSSDKMSTTWLTQAVSAADAWKEVLGGSSSATVYNALYKTLRSVSSFYGVSFSGVMREGVALWNNTAGSYDATLKVLTYGRSNAELGSLLLDSIIDGDERQADSLRGEFADEDAYQSALRTTIKDRYVAGEIDQDTALQYLVEYGGMEEDDAYWKVEEWEYESDTGEDFAKYNEFFTAVETGKNLKQVIKQYTDNGVELKTLSSQITSHFKPIYGEMTSSERAKIKGYLLNAFVQCGMDRKDAEDKIAEWQFESDYPELVDRITYAQYKKWQTNGKPKGVSVELFAKVTEFRGEGDDTKSQEEVADYINSLSISKAQKDALWCCFWSESTLHKAPWN